jgi:hypothetical protein
LNRIEAVAAVRGLIKARTKATRKKPFEKNR